MRSARLHSLADKLLLGYSNIEIHRIIDKPVKDLGAQHRQVNHSWQIVETMRDRYGEKGGKITLLHLLLDLDIIDSKYVEVLVKMQKEYLSVREVSVRMSISENTVRSWIKSGMLPARKIGKQWRITIADCDLLSGGQ